MPERIFSYLMDIFGRAAFSPLIAQFKETWGVLRLSAQYLPFSLLAVAKL